MSDLDLFGQPLLDRLPRRTSGEGTSARLNRTVAVALIALEVSRAELNSYSCEKSNHIFTQPQLMACLVLKAYLRCTYRDVIERLEVMPQVVEALGLKRLPNYSTLKKFADRLTTATIDRIAAKVLEWCLSRGLQVNDVAVDSTGIECSPASVHYTDRRGRQRGRYVKVSLMVSCGNLLLIGMQVSVGPTPDAKEAFDLLWPASGRCQPTALYADAGYDAESVHRFCREGWGVRSYIPPVARGGYGVIKSRWRSRMRPLPRCYGRRWHSETYISGLKRTTSPSVRARKEQPMKIEAALNVLAYAIRR